MLRRLIFLHLSNMILVKQLDVHMLKYIKMRTIFNKLVWHGCMETCFINQTPASIFLKNCLNNINDFTISSTLRMFKLFKEEYKFQDYLITTTNLNHASFLFFFGINSYNLRIEI